MKKIQKTKHRQPGPSMNSVATQLESKGLRLAATSRAKITGPAKSHIDDIAVDQLAIAQKTKLAECRAKGRGGWDSPLECSVEKLAQMMAEAVCKGDPVDVANFGAMLQARGASHKVIAEHAVRALLRGSREDQAQRIQEGDELRRAVRDITAMLANDEWAEHVSKDPDAKALEAAITELHNDLRDAQETLDACATRAEQPALQPDGGYPGCDVCTCAPGTCHINAGILSPQASEDKRDKGGA